MPEHLTRRTALLAGGSTFLAAAAAPALALGQTRPDGWAAYSTGTGEWRTYGGDLRSQRYSPLAQIDGGNFNRLRVAWRFKPDNLGPSPEVNLQATPLMVNGVMYMTAGTRRAAVALNATTGELLWKYNLDEGRRRGPRMQSGRGLAYWTDGQEERILYVTPGYQLVALDAKTGAPLPGFGERGRVDLRKELPDTDVDLDTADIGLAAAPLVVDDVIVIGAAHQPSTFPRKSNIKGAIRAYDVRTGRRLWTFRTIPQKGEFGHETWLNGSEIYTGNAGSWAQMSADPELGLVYFGVELPTGDWYGGARPGAGLFGESLLAVDIRTGERRWHYQMVHHGIWDDDVPCAAILADITVNGRRIKAIAQAQKNAWLYVLDRETGKPVWPIPERKVPKGDAPGEWYSPTQPHVTKPPAFDAQGTSIDDLIDFTPALRAEAVKIAGDYKLGPIFTPPAASRWPRPLATLVAATGQGAAQWPGGAFDPETNLFYIYSNSAYSALGIVPGDPQVTDNVGMLGQAPAPDGSADSSMAVPTVQGLPLFKPPYGRITAIDLNKGEHVWQTAHGETPDEVRNHPALKGVDVPRTGNRGKVGVLVTKTLIIAGDGTTTTAPDGEHTGWLRAYDKATGEERGAVKLAGRVTGSPMTYSVGGRQYLAVAVGMLGKPAELVVYRLPG
ncbi:PQQ-binding-like beta-propeller repeat protein [Phenylobacterium sp. SCN 70-31]|uniref:outer membrane protein assembly factor BamB family protein n=1 Tax=Phenylobacterium sp. SCN 70-31 TaxID=1660129 RepID=UPI00086A6DAC|nr:PQQ-binding-like beta-propeller repeat protein [Phenylobacterium sp. SCN 70-31]ODT89648.1 MAG: quinoprotein glucose dehydrogenase [Phenylobacterium sp. SCN 70-31]